MNSNNENSTIQEFSTSANIENSNQIPKISRNIVVNPQKAIKIDKISSVYLVDVIFHSTFA
jgi:hypothetical protein